MINVYFDSGTTNSRIFVLEGGRILYHDKAGTGCRDAALAGDPSILTRALRRLYQNALDTLHIKDEQVRGIYLSGMATSPSGLQEVEHLSAHRAPGASGKHRELPGKQLFSQGTALDSGAENLRKRRNGFPGRGIPGEQCPW